MRLLLLLTYAAALSGCSSAPEVRYEYKTVEVEKLVYCDPVVPPAPELPLFWVTKKSSDEEVAKAYFGSVVLLLGYTKELNLLLDGCRRPK